MNLLSNFLTSIKPRLDDTVIDRLNYYYSTLIITVMAITLTARQYVGQPLQCWVPAEFSKAWEQYAENYCFVYNTYWVSPDETIPNRVDERVSRQLLYYQWVPFIMALQAGCFYLPVIFYAKVSTKAGINVSDIIQILMDTEKTNKEQRSKAVMTVCQLLEESLRLTQIRRQNTASQIERAFKLGMLSGTYLANMYTLTKFFYLLNVVGQFVMMNQFLGQDNHLWGLNILQDITQGRDWEFSGNFPRVALCDFTVRNLANVRRFTIQCVLMLNMFNEKIFLFLYWWLVFVFVLTLMDIFRWQTLFRSASRREQFVKYDSSQKYMFRSFCCDLVNADVIFVLEMINFQVNELYTQELLESLWHEYRNSAQLQAILTNFNLLKRSEHQPLAAQDDDGLDDEDRPEERESRMSVSVAD